MNRSIPLLLTVAFLAAPLGAAAKIPKKSLSNCNSFTSYADIATLLQGYETTYPTIAETFSIGTSVEGARALGHPDLGQRGHRGGGAGDPDNRRHPRERVHGHGDGAPDHRLDAHRLRQRRPGERPCGWGGHGAHPPGEPGRLHRDVGHPGERERDRPQPQPGLRMGGGETAPRRSQSPRRRPCGTSARGRASIWACPTTRRRRT